MCVCVCVCVCASVCMRMCVCLCVWVGWWEVGAGARACCVCRRILCKALKLSSHGGRGEWGGRAGLVAIVCHPPIPWGWVGGAKCSYDCIVTVCHHLYSAPHSTVIRYEPVT